MLKYDGRQPPEKREKSSMQNSDLLQFTQDCIRIPSPPGEEGSMVERVIDEMRKLGYDSVRIDKAGNAIGVIEGKHPGQRILLDAHVDTVGVSAPDWSVDPFGGEIRLGRLFGRGSADTKGNLAAMMYAAARVDRSKLAGSVIVSASVSEEVMEGGSLQTVIAENSPDFVVIGEATELQVSRGGRGRAEIVIETMGQSAHSSSPEAGACAVRAMMRMSAAIDELPVRMDPVLGPGPMVLTDIISSPYPGHSVIPNRCRATFDRRLLPGETIESVIGELENCAIANNIVCRISVLDGLETTYSGLEMQGKKFFPAWILDEDHYLVQSALGGLRGLNPDTRLRAFRFCTNAAYSAGVLGIPTIGYGLGKETDAHTNDESISIDDLNQAAMGYQAIIEAVLNHN
jgi:putative selenium metabolism hydrolase